jgi:hypothetical protein
MQVSRQAIYRTPKRRTDPGPRLVSSAVDRTVRRGWQAEPDRRQPDGRSAHLARAGPAGEPQAGAAGDAPGAAVAAPPAAAPAAAAGFLARPAHRPALAHGHDLGLGGRARLVLPQRRDRLLHARDPGLGARAALPGEGGARRRRARASPLTASNRGSSCSAPTTAPRSRAAASAPGWPSSRSPIAAASYRDPESQAFIESWFSKLKERLIWRQEFETLDQARAAIGAYVERYHHRPHQFPRPPHPEGGEADLGGCPGRRASTKSSGLRCQRRGGPGQMIAVGVDTTKSATTR